MRTKISRALMVAAVALPAVLASACDLTGVETNDEPNVPTSLDGRPVDVQGTITVSSRDIVVRVWDGQTIDGDIISLYMNGEKVLNFHDLDGTPHAVSLTLDYEGYNYIAMWAHNEGDIPPNTAAMSIDDGTGERLVTLSANLDTNAALNVVVEK